MKIERCDYESATYVMIVEDIKARCEQDPAEAALAPEQGGIYPIKRKAYVEEGCWGDTVFVVDESGEEWSLLEEDVVYLKCLEDIPHDTTSKSN